MLPQSLMNSRPTAFIGWNIPEGIALTHSLRILTAADVRAALPMPAAIEAVRAGFIALSTGRAEVPIRASVSTQDGLMLYMPAYVGGAPISTVKVVGVYGQNPSRGLPTVV